MSRHLAARRRRAWLPLAVASIAAVVAGLVLPVLVSTPARAEGSLTVSGSGPFSSLKVTVAKTTELVGEAVKVSWAGGVPTQGQGNFLTIMQCWGDDPSGPSREQCQFGAFASTLSGQAASRQLFFSDTSFDSNEKQYTPAFTDQLIYVPFRPVTNEDVEVGDTNALYDANTSNEVPRALTYGDGTGEVYFNVQTAKEAPGLGCGAEVDDVTTSVVEKVKHKCWLVVVPRAGDELPGISTPNSGGVLSSPLSTTNWAQRIVIPLAFQDVVSKCALGKAEVQSFGNELVAEAFTSWQPALCGTTGRVYGYTQIPDDLARSTVVRAAAPDGGLGFVSGSVPADQAGGASLVYAPVAVSAVGIGFVVERQVRSNATLQERSLEGRRIPEIRLTPRLAAKILTQSYVSATPGNNPATLQEVTISGSITKQTRFTMPFSPDSDPEFLRLNPDFIPVSTSMAKPILPYIPADATDLLWKWIAADKDAMDFLAGKPNFDAPWLTQCGITSNRDKCLTPPDCSKYTDAQGVNGCPTYVNPAYKSMAVPLNTFPKSDSYCLEIGDLPQLCTFDLNPYANGMAEAALSVSKGDTLARTNFNGISWSRAPLQVPGTKNLLAVTDTPSAVRYALTMASLRTATGDFVAPTDDSLRAAVGGMKKDSNSVLVPDPTTTTAGAYPLTMVTYAVANPSTLTSESRAAYADFLTYAATDGQVRGSLPGQLPEGYVPLTPDLKRQAIAAANVIATAPVPSASPSPTPTATPTSTPAASPTTSSAPVDVPTVDQPVPVVPPQPIPTTGGAESPSPTTSPTPSPSPSTDGTPSTAPVALTQPLSAGASALGAAAALILGAMAAVGAVIALRLSRGGSS